MGRIFGLLRNTIARMMRSNGGLGFMLPALFFLTLFCGGIIFTNYAVFVGRDGENGLSPPCLLDTSL
jgi:hypothetical protein